MQRVEYVMLALLTAATLAVLFAVLMMILALYRPGPEAFEGAVLVLGAMGGGA